MRDMWQSQILLNSCRKSIHFGFPKSFTIFWEVRGEVKFLQRHRISPAHQFLTPPTGCAGTRIKWRMLCVFTNKCAERKACAQSNACSFIALFAIRRVFKQAHRTAPIHPCAFEFIHHFPRSISTESQWAFRIRVVINVKHTTMDYRTWVYRYRYRHFCGAK